MPAFAKSSTWYIAFFTLALIVVQSFVSAAKPGSYDKDAQVMKLKIYGAIKLCPAGGKAFTMAWGLACEMKRRKRSSGLEPSEESSPRGLLNSLGRKKREMRPATLTEIMRICCELGCEIRDLLPYCDPFGSWNS